MPENVSMRDRVAETSASPSRPLVEKYVAELWSEVLGIAEPGPQDDFFELGGDSLAATRIISRLRQRFGIELTLDAVFSGPSVADLAGLVSDLIPSTTHKE